LLKSGKEDLIVYTKEMQLQSLTSKVQSFLPEYQVAQMIIAVDRIQKEV